MTKFIKEGKIISRRGECFWIFLSDYFYEEKNTICSPWFSHMEEQWILIKDPSTDGHLSVIFRLWKKIQSIESSKRFIVKLSLISSEDELFEKTGYVDSDYGCEFVFKFHRIQPYILWKNRQMKVFIDIQKEESTDNNISTNNTETCTKEEENGSQESSSEDEEYNDDSDEDKDISEKKDSAAVSKGIHGLVENLKQVFLEKKMCNAVLEVENRELHVHKVILVARSPVFASMFEHDLAEKNTNIVKIPDCTAESFEIFLHYLYTGILDAVSSNNVLNLYYAADKYQVKDLKEKCVKFMKKSLSIATLFDTIVLCLRHGETKLLKLAIDFFSANIKDVLKTVQWQQYMIDNPTHANELLIKAHNL